MDKWEELWGQNGIQDGGYSVYMDGTGWKVYVNRMNGKIYVEVLTSINGKPDEYSKLLAFSFPPTGIPKNDFEIVQKFIHETVLLAIKSLNELNDSVEGAGVPDIALGSYDMKTLIANKVLQKLRHRIR